MAINYVLLSVVLANFCAGLLCALGMRYPLAFLISVTIVIASAFVAAWWAALSMMVLHTT